MLFAIVICGDHLVVCPAYTSTRSDADLYPDADATSRYVPGGNESWRAVTSFPPSVTRAPSGSGPMETAPLSIFNAATAGGGAAGALAGTIALVAGSSDASGAPRFALEK